MVAGGLCSLGAYLAGERLFPHDQGNRLSLDTLEFTVVHASKLKQRRRYISA